MKTTPKPSQIVLMASGAVLFFFSLLPFFKASGESRNAWSGDIGTLFMATWPALFGLAVGGLVAAKVFADVALPERILTFTFDQVVFVLAFTSFVIMFGYLLGGGIPDAGGFGPDKAFGFYFMFLGAIGLLAGAVMELLGIEVGGSSGSTAGPSAGSGPATPF